MGDVLLRNPLDDGETLSSDLFGWGQGDAQSPASSSGDSEESHKRGASCLGEEADETSSPVRSRKPMRKRAKTQEEKEQRAQERVMRNRAAAQISRERKREYVSTLEQENRELNERVSALSSQNNNLLDSVSSLTTRLESLEKLLQYFTPGDLKATGGPLDERPKTHDILDAPELSQLPTPPGTIRPHDLQSNPSTTSMGTLDLRNPAVIASGPQRQSMQFPWNLSSHSPIYRQMDSILVFWRTILRVTTLPAFATQLSITLDRVTSPQRSVRKILDHRRSLATCPRSTARSLRVGDDDWSDADISGAFLAQKKQ